MGGAGFSKKDAQLKAFMSGMMRTVARRDGKQMTV